MEETIADAEARVKAREEQLNVDTLRMQGSILRYERDRERLRSEMLKLASTTKGGFAPAPREDRLLVSGSEAEDLAEAVEYLKAKLIADELEPVAELLNEQMVKDAIRSAVATNDARMHIIAKEWPSYPAAWEGFRDEFLEVAENGTWTGCSFDFSYVPHEYVGEKMVSWPGLIVKLMLRREERSFAVPILEISYGRFPAYPMSLHPHSSLAGLRGEQNE